MTYVRSNRLVTLLAALGVFAVVALAAAQTSSAATRGCKAPKEPAGLNGGYFTELRATNVSCRSARKLVIAYYKCRRKRGGDQGTCHNRTVNGLRCKESRPSRLQSDTQINARVTCTRGRKKVRHSYQQNLRPS
ncbi:MAG TPA: hypothetical protein VNT54_13155 [Solirubrobacteraceae bacterium]|nr:hypothetical protein [Solirubrobacteraceae bacterium]